MASLVTGANPQPILTTQIGPRGTAHELISTQSTNIAPTMADLESIWGPVAREVKDDADRFQKISRRHLTNMPNALKGQQIYIADRIDGLITNATGSPFTSLILPYMYWSAPDSKIKWRVFSYDEGMASRVPYEAAARTLTQSQEKFSSYATRHGLSITMEHNFMMTEQGHTDFYHQLQQVVGSIQKTNDLQVHLALIKARSYFRKVRERYYRDNHSLEDEIRDYVNSFGFLQKNMNGLDILIEDAKQLLRGWGAQEPNFLLINSRLTFQLQMNPERTQYVTQGPDGQRRLEEGPDIKSYRGIRIIHSHSFPIQDGEAPRDLLRRRVRVCEFYLLPNCNNLTTAAAAGTAGNAGGGAPDGGLQLSGLHRLLPGERDNGQGTLPILANEGMAPPSHNNPSSSSGQQQQQTAGSLRIYDESSDSFVVIRYEKLLDQCRKFIARANMIARRRPMDDPLSQVIIPDNIGSVLLLRPNIEHYMLGMIMGKGGSMDDLGATLWGQTELSCFDDGQHGVWGMSYKYHASSIVFNERNLHRMWDIAYDGYCGGKDCSILDWSSDSDLSRFIKSDSNLNTPYSGPSIIVLPLPTQVHTLPSPLPIANFVNSTLANNAHGLATSDLFVEDMHGFMMRVGEKTGEEHLPGVRNALSVMFDVLHLHRNSAAAKCANLATVENEATLIRLGYGGTYQYKLDTDVGGWVEIFGCGHHGPDFVGKASERAGKGVKINGPPLAARLI
jgi:hypothetical protein